jgi:hypothetical protein
MGSFLSRISAGWLVGWLAGWLAGSLSGSGSAMGSCVLSVGKLSSSSPPPSLQPSFIWTCKCRYVGSLRWIHIMPSSSLWCTHIRPDQPSSHHIRVNNHSARTHFLPRCPPPPPPPPPFLASSRPPLQTLLLLQPPSSAGPTVGGLQPPLQPVVSPLLPVCESDRSLPLPSPSSGSDEHAQTCTPLIRSFFLACSQIGINARGRLACPGVPLQVI